MVFHSVASTTKCYSQLFPSFKKKKKNGVFSEVHSSYLNHPSLIRTPPSYRVVASVHFPLCDCSPLVNWNMHPYHNPQKASSFFTITFATSQQYQTYLSTASVWFSHSSELWSLPKSAAQLASLLAWPTPLLGVGEEERGTNNNGSRKPVRSKHSFLYGHENWSRKAMHLQEKHRQH